MCPDSNRRYFGHGYGGSPQPRSLKSHFSFERDPTWLRSHFCQMKPLSGDNLIVWQHFYCGQLRVANRSHKPHCESSILSPASTLRWGSLKISLCLIQKWYHNESNILIVAFDIDARSKAADDLRRLSVQVRPLPPFRWFNQHYPCTSSSYATRIIVSHKVFV